MDVLSYSSKKSYGNKTIYYNQRYVGSLILAKNHMVTKHNLIHRNWCMSLILAKNHMVTKQKSLEMHLRHCLILAKNHMVTKQPFTCI